MIQRKNTDWRKVWQEEGKTLGKTLRRPLILVNSNIKKFLQNRFVPSPLDSPSRKKFYLSFPYFGYQSEKLRIELSKLLSKYFSSIDFHTINTIQYNNTITSFPSPCNPLWCINLVVHSVYLSTSVLPCVRSTPELLSMRVGASELEPFLRLLLILTLEPMHSLAEALSQLTILIF